MKKILKCVSIIVLFLLLYIIGTNNKVFAEGTRDMYDWSITSNSMGNNSRWFFDYYESGTVSTGMQVGTSIIDNNTVIKVYAKQGEKIKFATSGNGAELTTPSGNTSIISVTQTQGEVGFIYDYNEEKDKTYTYYEIEATETGTYSFLMTNNCINNSYNQQQANAKLQVHVIDDSESFVDQQGDYYIAAWDIQVEDENGNEINGRIWMDYVSIYRGYGLTSWGYVDFYALTDDGYTYKMNLNGVDPGGMNFFIGTRGLVDKETNQIIYKSVENNTIGDTVLMPIPSDGESEFDSFGKIFFNSPSTDLPKDIYSDKIDSKITEKLTFNGNTNEGEAATSGTFSFSVSETCTYTITITDKDTGNIVRTLNNVALKGENTVIWDGKDEDGNYVDEGSYEANLQVRNGEYHFLLNDVETVRNGIIIKSEDTGDSTIYYNDTIIGGSDVSTTGVSSEDSPYSYATNVGDLKLINLWTYNDVQDSTDFFVLNESTGEKCTISGLVFHDKNNSKTYDITTESVFVGVKINVIDQTTGEVYKTITTTSGEFSISVPKGDTYKIEVDSDYKSEYLTNYTNTTSNESQTIAVTEDIDVGDIGYFVEEKTLTIKKVWDDCDNILKLRPDAITVKIKNGENEVASVTVKATENWENTINLPKYENGIEITYSVEEEEISSEYSKSESSVTVDGDSYTITNKLSLSDDKNIIAIIKNWDDNGNELQVRPDSINVNIKNGDTVVKNVELKSSDNWTAIVDDLPKYDEDSNKINYTLEEESNDYYTVSNIETLFDDGKLKEMKVTNAIVKTKEITINKVWDDCDNIAKKRPDSIRVNVINDDHVVTTAVINADENWTKKVVVPAYDKSGNEVIYDLDEEEFSEDYPKSESSISNNINTYTITNKIDIQEKIAIGITKIWDDQENKYNVRPDSLKIKVKNGIITVGEVELNEENNWTDVVVDLDKYDEFGNEIEYTLSEDNVDYYKNTKEEVVYNSGNVKSINVTNTLQPDFICIKVVKKWNDCNNKYNTRPLEITVKVKNGDDVVKEATIESEDNWETIISALPKYDSDGKEITYTIEEDSVEGYVYTGATELDYIADEDTELLFNEADKWSENKDGTWQSTSNVGTSTLTSDVFSVSKETELSFDWSVSCSNTSGNAYNKYEIINTETNEVVYTEQILGTSRGTSYSALKYDNVKKTLPAGSYKIKFTFYRSSSGSGGLNAGFVKNVQYKQVYSTKKTEITNEISNIKLILDKVWNDNEDSKGIRPESITVNIKNGNSIVKTVEITADNDWEAEIDELPIADENGNLINYTFEEEKVEGYGYSGASELISVADMDMDLNIASSSAWKQNSDGTWQSTNTTGWGTLKSESFTVDVPTVLSFDWSVSCANNSSYSYAYYEIKNVATGETVDGTGYSNTKIYGTSKGTSYASLGYYNVSKELPAGTYEVDFYFYRYTTSYSGGLNAAFAKNLKYTNVYNTKKAVLTNDLNTMDIVIEKEWDDYNDIKKIRPSSITVNIKNGDTIIKTVDITADNNWKTEIENLPKFDDDGNKINYTIEENEISGYTRTDSAEFYDITDEGTDLNTVGMKIVNKVDNKSINVNLEKIWEDYNNKDGDRPSSVTVNIKNGNTIVKTVDITAEDDWKKEVIDLPKYDDGGNEINYTFEEDNVSGYTRIDSGELTDVSDIAVNLDFADTTNWTQNEDDTWKNTNTSGTATLISKDFTTSVPTVLSFDWTISSNATEYYSYGTYTITNVETGEIISGTGTDTKISGSSRGTTYDSLKYESVSKALDAGTYRISFLYQAYSGVGGLNSEYVKNLKYTQPFATKSLRIVNTINTVNINLSKNWDDAENTNKVRPNAITVNIKNGDTIVKTVQLLESDGWTKNVKGLPKYDDDGTEITYTIEEESVDNYMRTDNSEYEDVLDADVSVDLIPSTNWKQNEDGTWQSTNASGTSTISTEEFTVDSPTTLTFERSVSGYNSSSYGYAIYTITNVTTGTTVVASNTTKIYGTSRGTTYDALTYDTVTKELDAGTYKITFSYYNYSTSRVAGLNAAFVRNISYKASANTKAMTITNTINLTDITVKKTWNDNEDALGVRPTSINVKLMNKTTIVAEHAVTASDSWEYTFENLAKYDESGNEIVYTAVEDKVPNYEMVSSEASTENVISIVNKYVESTTADVTIHKKTADGLFEIPGAVLAVYKNNDAMDLVEEFTTTTEPHVIKNLEQGEYILAELTAPEGYLCAESINFEVSADEDNTVTMYDEVDPLKEVKDVTVIKIWNDDSDKAGKRPTSIKFGLYQIDEDNNETLINTYTMTKPTTDSDRWTYKIEGLHTYIEVGTRTEKVSYVIKEIDTGSIFYKSICSDVDLDGGSATITNTFSVPDTKINLIVNKVWNDNSDSAGKRPNSIKVQLYANNKLVSDSEKTISVTDSWTTTYSDLAKYDENGDEISYSAKEVETGSIFYTLDNATYSTIDNTTTITNKFEVPDTKTTLTVNKVWDDNSDSAGKRPSSVKVQLYADGKAVSDTEKNISASDSWTITYSNLAKYDSNGNEISYSAKETETGSMFYTLANATYLTSDGITTITNKFVVPSSKVSVKAVKVWDDNNDEAKKRPTSVTMNVYANGGTTAIKTYSLIEAESWEHTFDDLAMYDEKGDAITYTIEEKLNDSNYAITDTNVTEVNGVKVTTVTNTFEASDEQKSVTVNKIWDDSSYNGKRPTSISIDLKNGDKVVGTKVLNDENKWSATFENLAKYDKYNNEITYTAVENFESIYYSQVDYKTTTDSSNNDIITITNKYSVPADTVDKVATKIWNDKNNKNGNRPESITMILKDETGAEIARKVVTGSVTTNDGWTCKFTGLAKYDEHGDEKTYSVDELDVSSLYAKEINGLTITNTYKLNNSKVDNTSIEKDGTIAIERKDDPVDYTITYTAIVVDFAGNAKVTIVDKLPYEIDETNSSLDGGIYDATSKTITWIDSISDIDTFTNGEKNVEITKNITVKYLNIEKLTKLITNKVTGDIVLENTDVTNTVDDTTDTTITLYGKVITNYFLDGTDTKLAEEDVIEGKVDEKYVTSSKSIDFYKLISSTDNASGLIKSEDTFVNYYYKALSFDIGVTEVIDDVRVNGESIDFENSKDVVTEIENSDSDVLVEYNIGIKNYGELKGDAKIVVSIPDGMEFVYGDDDLNIKDNKIYIDVSDLLSGDEINAKFALRWINDSENFKAFESTATIISTKNDADFVDCNNSNDRDGAIFEIKEHKNLIEIITEIEEPEDIIPEIIDEVIPEIIDEVVPDTVKEVVPETIQKINSNIQSVKTGDMLWIYIGILGLASVGLAVSVIKRR